MFRQSHSAKKIIQNEVGGLVSEQLINQLSEIESITPAVVTRSSKVIKSISEQNDNRDTEYKTIIGSCLTAQGHRFHLPKSSEQADIYSLGYVNASDNLEDIAQGFKKNGVGRMCLFGPPGTGKTAFGHWLANYLDKPIVLKKASDLMSMYLGGTEKNIAKAFEEAAQENAILQIDEVDSFLQNRNQATKSWEVSQVNEMLVQMENFDGIFIASTNLMDGLDDAAFRRFDIAIKFDYMTVDQTRKLFMSYCQKLNINADKDNESQLQKLIEMTPGDFASCYRKTKFTPVETANDWLSIIEKYSGQKSGSKAVVGF